MHNSAAHMLNSYTLTRGITDLTFYCFLSFKREQHSYISVLVGVKVVMQ